GLHVAAREGDLGAASLEPRDRVPLDRHLCGIELREGLLENRSRALEIAAGLAREARSVGRLGQRSRPTYLSREDERLFAGCKRTWVAAREQADRERVGRPPPIHPAAARSSRSHGFFCHLTGAR